MAPQKRQLQPRSLFASLSLNRRCKKSPLSLRPRASQRIVISFYPQAASLSLGREPAKCECTKAQKHKSTKLGQLLLNVLKFCPRPLSHGTIPHICSMLVNHAKCETSKSDSQLCQICQACELHKNVLNFSLLGTQRRDTTALEEAFEFKAR